MKIVTILHAHGDPKTTQDTIESIKKYVTNDIIAVLDGIEPNHLDGVDVEKIVGFRHGTAKAPYKNYALSILQTYKTWKDANWVCCTEWDTLFMSDKFKEELDDSWCIGSNLRTTDTRMPIIEDIFKREIKNTYYMLGSCIFYSTQFLEKLIKNQFFEKFLHLTNDFEKGWIPNYKGYDISEHLYPTLAGLYGGKVKGLSKYNERFGFWSGNYKSYAIRWRPELNINFDYFEEASILHPIKNFDNPIRILAKEKRNK